MLLLRWSILHDGPYYTDLPYFRMGRSFVKVLDMAYLSTKFEDSGFSRSKDTKDDARRVTRVIVICGVYKITGIGNVNVR